MLKRAAHPGEILKDELAEIGVTPTELARQIDVPANRMSQIINAKRSITGDTALRLAHWFKTDPQFWMNGPLLAAAVGISATRRLFTPRSTRQQAASHGFSLDTDGCQYILSAIGIVG